jgi:hypothetical protein
MAKSLEIGGPKKTATELSAALLKGKTNKEAQSQRSNTHEMKRIPYPITWLLFFLPPRRDRRLGFHVVLQSQRDSRAQEKSTHTHNDSIDR